LTKKSVFTKRYCLFLDGIIAARRCAALTQQQLADRLGRPQSYVSKYERGERRLDVLEFVDIADALDVNPCLMLNALRKGGSSR